MAYRRNARKSPMARELPSGTVTFLFTDIEGSTQLLHELGAEAYAEVLAEHHRVLREALGRCGGVEVDTQGDAFFVAFRSSTTASDRVPCSPSGRIPGLSPRISLRSGRSLPTFQPVGYGFRRRPVRSGERPVRGPDRLLRMRRRGSSPSAHVRARRARFGQRTLRLPHR